MSAAKMTKKTTTEPASAKMSQDPQTPQEKTPETVDQPDPEVVAKTDRRQFTDAYKRSIVEQAEQCQGSGDIGALLRREGLYSSHLSTWRRAQRNGTLGDTKARPRGPSAATDAATQREIAQLKAQNQRLENELSKARTIIDIQKKLSVLLSMTPTDGTSS